MLIEIKTERLILKVLTPQWAPQVLRFYEENREFFEPWEADRHTNFYSLDYQGRMLYYDYLAYEKGTQVRFWIFLKSNPDVPIGTVSFHNILHGIFQCCNIGYKMDHTYKKHGYCREAVMEACTYLFTHYELHRIEALIHPDNHASLHFIETLGFQREGLRIGYAKLRGHWQDHICYSLISPFDE